MRADAYYRLQIVR